MGIREGYRELIKKMAQSITVIIGFGALVFGELDDSPGLQGIGLILILSVFFSIFKIVKR
jgi:hypothetical protein